MKLSNKEIADRLTVQANESRETNEKIVILRIDGFSIKCRDTREHILMVADKYRKAKSLKTRQEKDWGVWGSKLSRKLISTRYANDWDRHEFYQLVK